MTWSQIKVGAEPKKVAILAALLLAAGYFFISSRNSGDSGASAKSTPVAAPPAVVPGKGARPAGRPNRATKAGLGRNDKDWRASIRKIDDPNVDPTLHLNLLAKLQDVKVEGVGRSLFEIGAAPAVVVAKEPDKIKPAAKPFVGPVQPKPPPPDVKPPTPRAPQIPLKFYGFVNPSRTDIKRAFFLDGEEIIIAAEGELVKKRYKVLRIGVNSAVVEDTTFKGDNTQQTLPLELEMNG
ncbi:MAG TPA: hypothetical protein VIX89_18830 [Bryobacteraceae bacterium]